MKANHSSLTEVQRAALQSGDLVFTAVRSPFYRQVARTCRSWESHVGIIFREPNGELVVAESRVPVSSYTTLEKFLARSAEGKFAIRRLHGGLTEEHSIRLRQAADARMGRIYHLGFDYDSRREFCSKLVYAAYHEALGIEVGQLETFDELLHQNPTAPLGFWRAWFFGFIPWQRRTVTTTSVLNSPRLTTIVQSGNLALA
jgi:hypothetical protein